MLPQRGYYSLVQYCPDVSRLEGVNVGLVLYCPEISFLDVRMTTSNERIARVFGREGLRPASLDAAKRGLAARLRSENYRPRSLEEFQHFVDTRGNDLVLTQPRPVVVVQPEEDLANLYRRLVEGPPCGAEYGSASATEVDRHDPQHQSEEERVTSEPQRAPTAPPPGAVVLPVEAVLDRKSHPVAVEGIVENGLIRPLDPDGKLLEGSRVIIVAAEPSAVTKG